MNIEQQSKIIETGSMMEALGYKQVSTDERDDGIYITYMLPRKIELPHLEGDELIIPGAQ